MAKTLTEAQAWRILAERVAEHPENYDVGLCYVMKHRPERLRGLGRVSRLRNRLEQMVTGVNRCGPYLDVFSDFYTNTRMDLPDARVIFCLLMALEAGGK